MRTEHRPKLEMGRQIGYLFGWPVIVGQVFGVESPETPTEEKGVGGCDGPEEPVNTSGTPSGGEQAPNPGSGAATECVRCGHDIDWHREESGMSPGEDCFHSQCHCIGYFAP